MLSAADTAPALPVLAADKITEMQDVMEEEFQELMELFLSDAQTQLTQIETAYAAGDAETLARTAHALKSSSGYVGAAQMAELARSLDEQGRQGLAAINGELIRQLRLVTQQTEVAVAALFD